MNANNTKIIIAAYFGQVGHGSDFAQIEISTSLCKRRRIIAYGYDVHLAATEPGKKAPCWGIKRQRWSTQVAAELGPFMHSPG